MNLMVILIEQLQPQQLKSCLTMFSVRLKTDNDAAGDSFALEPLKLTLTLASQADSDTALNPGGWISDILR